MKRYLSRILKFYLVAGAICVCGYAALVLGGYFDEAPLAGYIQQAGAAGADPAQVADLLGDEVRLSVHTNAADPVALAREYLEQDASAVVLDLARAPEGLEELVQLAEDRQATVIFLGAQPGRKALTYENSWYVGSDPAQAGELLGQEAAMLFREGGAADRNGDLLLQYLWVGDADQDGAATLCRYTLDECEHYGVYTAEAGALSLPAAELADQIAAQWAEPAALPEIALTGDPAALEALEQARSSLPWWSEDYALPMLTTAPDRATAEALVQSGRAAAVAWYDTEAATDLTARMLLNVASLRFVGQGSEIQPDGQSFAIPFQLTTL